MPECKVYRCKNKTRSNLCPYCEMHYYRLRRTGKIEKQIKYSIPNNIFINLNRAKAWVLGLIWSDGNIRGNRVSITSNDYQMLKIVETILDGKNIIKKRINGKASDIVFSNKQIALDLLSYGLIECKSKTIKWPRNLKTSFEWDFIRGLFDGDGTISISRKNRFQASIVSASPFLSNKIYDFFNKEKLYPSITRRPNGIFVISINRINSLKKMYKKMYKNTNNYLDRKYNIFSKILYREHCKKGRKSRIQGGIWDVDKQSDNIVNHYLSIAKTTKNTAEFFNISEKTVINLLKRRKIKTFSGRSIYERIDKSIKESIIKESQTMTFSQIKQKYKINRNTIRKILKENKWEN